MLVGYGARKRGRYFCFDIVGFVVVKVVFIVIFWIGKMKLFVVLNLFFVL